MIGIGLWNQMPAVSPPALDGTESVQYRCLYAIQSRLSNVAFPDVKDIAGGADIPLQLSSIVVKKLPIERIYNRKNSPLPLPCIIITPQKEAAPPTAGVTDKDDYTHNCLVTMVMADNEEPTLVLNLGIISLWRQKTMRAFQNQRLPGVRESLITTVEPAEAVIPAAWGRNVLASAVLIKPVCRETRGLT